MVNRIAPSVVVVAAPLASAALPAAAQALSAPQARGAYTWLHPKLGIVKVDRATGAMVPARRVSAQATLGAAVSEGSRYQVDPKVNLQAVTTQRKEAN